jgi:hypothetical protein
MAPVRALLVTAPCRRTAARQQTGIARLLALFRHTGVALLVGQLAKAREIPMTRQGASQLAGAQLGRGSPPRRCPAQGVTLALRSVHAQINGAPADVPVH